MKRSRRRTAGFLSRAEVARARANNSATSRRGAVLAREYSTVYRGESKSYLSFGSIDRYTREHFSRARCRM